MRLHSLTTRFVLTLLLSTAVPFLAFGWYVQVVMREQLEEQVVRVFLTDHAGRAAERIESRLDQLSRDSHLWKPSAERALDDEAAIADFVRDVELTRAFSADFHLVVLADTSGRVIAEVRGLGQDAATSGARTARLQAIRVDDQEWFRAVVADGGGDRWVGRHLSPFLHANPDRATRNPTDWSIGYAFGVFGDRGLSGVVFALVRWSRLQDIVDRTAEKLARDAAEHSGTAAVCSRDGTVIAHSDRARYNTALEPAELRDLVLAGAATVGRYVDRDGPGLAGTAPLAELGWRVVVSASERELFAASRRFGRVLLIVTAAAGAVLVAWSVWASRRIVRPVRDLVEGTRRIAHGDLTAKVPATGRDELADLGRSFNLMADDLQASQTRLRAAERKAAWAEMARQIAHEIKNPLTPMRMSAQITLRAQREQDPRLPGLVERLGRTVLDQTEALARIASDFSHFAGPPTHEPIVIEADSLLRDADTEFHAIGETGAALRLDPGAPGLLVRVDAHELRRVLANLIHNALAACGTGGTVEVRSAPGEGDTVRFSVTDDGPGITDDVRARLFEPYFTTRSAGTGLGLAICRRIVEAHGGSIELAGSEPGRTEFVFRLPVWTTGEGRPPS